MGGLVTTTPLPVAVCVVVPRLFAAAGRRFRAHCKRQQIRFAVVWRGQNGGHDAISQLIYTTLRCSRKSRNEGKGTVPVSAGTLWLGTYHRLTKHFVLEFGKLVECGFDEATVEMVHVFIPVLNGGVL